VKTRPSCLLAALLALVAASLFIAGRSTATAAAQQSAIFAGGCFWCVEEAFDGVPGVTATTSGYTGGTVPKPTYKQVYSGGTGHFEAVKVDYDPTKVSYDQLLQVFWRNIDPFDAAGQFCDKGESYRAAIFVAGDAQKNAAEKSLQDVAARFKQPIATEVRQAGPFYPAEDYHQDYHNTNSIKYKFYKNACGRAARLEEIWGKPAA
jgi:peptide-methionine (S)-S-oxide reductase